MGFYLTITMRLLKTSMEAMLLIVEQECIKSCDTIPNKIQGIFMDQDLRN
jgi:hypothetical protein